MKTKSFQEYLEQRLDKAEIIEIEEQAELEIRILLSIQKAIADTMNEYMEKNKIGFNELVRKLDWSPTKIAKIQRGEANLTLASLAHLFALLGKEPQEVFRSKK
jgi:hypothetical protein